MNFLVLGSILTWYVVDAADLHPATFCDGEVVFRDIIDGVSNSERGFGADVFKTMCQHEPSNIAVSPLATYLGVSKVYFGADEPTRQNISKIANITCNCLDAQFGLQDITRNIQTLNGPDVRVMNHVLYKPDLKLKYPFAKIIESVFGNLPQPFDFSQKSANSKLVKFLLRNHAGLTIKSGPKYIDETDSLVLIDTATYIQRWPMINHTYYDPPTTFFGNTPTEVSFLHTMGKFIYGHTDASGIGVKYVGIPIENFHHNVNMFIILPEDEISMAEGLNDITVNDDLLHKMIVLGEKKDVHVALPQFDITFAKDITHNLREIMGDRPFTNATNLFGITDTRKIHIDRVLHFARIQLKQQCGTSLNPQPSMERLIGNRPFIIVITTVGSSPLILMMGRYLGQQPNFVLPTLGVSEH